ncbi:discoidin domain-containing protein [bacterium]|nr:MAG: discoidin domain-containing protein [bacterium]
MVRLPGVIVNVSSEYSSTWTKNRLIDGNLNTSWFTAVNDAANLGKSPYIEIIFPQAVNIKGVNLKGNREYQNGYDILEGTLIVNSQSGSSSYNVKFPEPNRDFDITFNQNINSVSSVKFQITKDESVDPGLAEFEVVAAN